MSLLLSLKVRSCVSCVCVRKRRRGVVGADALTPPSHMPSSQVCRQTDGLLLSSQYPVNYFSITQIEQWFRDDFRSELAKVIGNKAFDTERNENFWR